MAAPFRVHCPNCGSELRLKDRSALGKRVRCPKCSNPFRLGKKSPSATKKAASPAPPEDDFLGALDSANQDDFGSAYDEFGPADEDEFNWQEEQAPSQLPTRKRSSGSRPVESESAPKKKRKKKKRRKQKKIGFSDSAFVSFLIWVGCGSIGGAIGAAIWAGIGYYTGYEVGIIAWGIGGLVGFGVAVGGGEYGGTLAGLTGAVIAVFSIFAGKFVLASLFVQQYASEMSVQDVNDPEVLVAQIAIDVAAEMEAEERTLDWPQGSDYESGNYHQVDREDFPAIVWSKAQQRWNEMDEEQQQDIKHLVQVQNEMIDATMNSTAARTLVTGAAFLFSFGLFDLLWLFLATTTAFKLSMGISGLDD